MKLNISCLWYNFSFFCPCPFHSGSMGFRFDEHGMILPHTILGSLEDYRSYLEAKGETEVFFKCSNFCRWTNTIVILWLCCVTNLSHCQPVGEANTKFPRRSSMWGQRKESLRSCRNRNSFKPKKHPGQCLTELGHTCETSERTAGLLIWWAG